MKVLITGAAGFLGRHFLDFHLAKGDEVTAIDNYQSPYAIKRDDIAPLDCRVLFGSSMAGVYDRVYHFAAMVGGREKIEGDPLFNADSLELDALLFRWVSRDPPGLVVYPSSSAVYGIKHQGAGSTTYLRESMVDPSCHSWDKPDEMYGFTKLAGEVLAAKAARYGVRTLCIRPFSGYGFDQSPEYPMRAIANRFLRREDPIIVWGSGEQIRDWVHVDDIVAATDAYADLVSERSGHYEAVNIGTGKGNTFLGLVRKLSQLTGYEPDIATVITKPTGVMTRVADVNKLQAVYAPSVSLEDGLKRMLA